MIVDVSEIQILPAHRTAACQGRCRDREVGEIDCRGLNDEVPQLLVYLSPCIIELIPYNFFFELLL